MKYKYTMPETLDQLLAGLESSTDVKRLSRLARSKALFQAINDWPYFKQLDDIMEAAKATCKQHLLEQAETAITNNLEAFCMLFLQTYYGTYLGVIETSQRNAEDMDALKGLVCGRSESVAVSILDQVAETDDMTITGRCNGSK